MTTIEAIKELREASDNEVRYGDTYNHYDEVIKRIEAFDVAIKALERKDVLDKIRAEIIHEFNNLKKGMTVYDIVQIIKKYKTESEVAE